MTAPIEVVLFPRIEAREILREHMLQGDGARPASYLAGMRGQDRGERSGVEAALWDLGRAELDAMVAAGVVVAA